MDLDELVISIYVTIDDQLKIVRQRLYAERLRQRGPAPALTDAEVLTMECVGEFLSVWRPPASAAMPAPARPRKGTRL